MWAVYALLSAFFIAATDPIAKKALRTSDEYVVGWLLLLFSVPFLAVYYSFSNAAPITPELLWILAAIMPIEVLAVVLYYRALRLTDISLSVPFLALTPVFAIITAYFLLGERIRPAGMCGIALITIGVYSLNIREAKYGIVSPIRAIFLNRGSLYMVFVAVIYSVTATVSKKAMLASSPQSIPFIYNLAASISMLPVILYRMSRNKSSLNHVPANIVLYLALGLCLAISSIFFFKAMSLAGVANAVAIKRLSLAISVFYGWVFFRERDIRLRLLSTICMIVGIALVLI